MLSHSFLTLLASLDLFSNTNQASSMNLAFHRLSMTGLISYLAEFLWREGNRVKINRIWKIVFFIYICFLLFFVVVKPFGFIDRMHSIQINRNSGIWNYSLDPFRSFSSYFRHRTDWYAYTNILGNIIPFVPFGFLIPIISKKYRRFINFFSLCLIIIIGIESFQFVTMLGFF